MNKDGRFAYSPIFDNGAGLLADTSLDYPLGKDVYLQVKEVRAKTISADFDEQLDLSEKLYGNHLKFSIGTGFSVVWGGKGSSEYTSGHSERIACSSSAFPA